MFKSLIREGDSQADRVLHSERNSLKSRLHLVWIHDRIFIKPLPRHLLSYEFWEISSEANPLDWGIVEIKYERLQ